MTSFMWLLAAALLQQTRSFTIALDAAAARATPLFGPVGESRWAPDWRPTFIHPVQGAERPGVVFTTESHGRKRLWLLAEYDVPAGRVVYVVVDPDVMVTEIRIAVRPDGARRSTATVTYRRSALAEDANAQVTALDDRWAETERQEWETAINAALRKPAVRRE